MRNGSHRLGLCMAAVAAGSLIAVPAASGGGFPDVVGGGADVAKHDTEVTISKDRGLFFHGSVISEPRRCEDGRRVVLFKQRPGADRKLDTVRSTGRSDRGRNHNWSIILPKGTLDLGDRVYAKATREANDRFVCRAARSGTHRLGPG